MIQSSSWQLAEAVKVQFSCDYSDHLALVRAYEGWNNAEKDLAGYEYCWKNFLSAQSMKAIDALWREFYSLLKDTGLVDSTTTTWNSWSYDVHLLCAVICYGLYPGICSVVVSQWPLYFRVCFLLISKIVMRLMMELFAAWSPRVMPENQFVLHCKMCIGSLKLVYE